MNEVVSLLPHRIPYHRSKCKKRWHREHHRGGRSVSSKLVHRSNTGIRPVDGAADITIYLKSFYSKRVSSEVALHLLDRRTKQ
ncbi:hypothetical protein BHM03_00002918 [Ensete ventricosum]|nr:hypothetical protein BHM03_00002918 [Ensete ventricosum]